MRSIAVIGGGPAGMMAAAEAAERGFAVTLLEKNEKLGKKLFITGKGRCNITNAAEIEDFFKNIPRNPKFLYSALYGFTNEDVMAMVKKQGVALKTERGGRVFPVSDKSSDILRAFSARVREAGVKVLLNTEVKSVSLDPSGDGFLISYHGTTHRFDGLVLATGGASYPATGSTGDGYRFAEALGHTVTDIVPALIPLETEEEWPKSLQGLSLKNVTLKAFNAKGRVVYEELGEMLFTHFGVSGPLVLSASSFIGASPAGTRLTIDLKPGLTADELDRRILRDFDANIRKQFINALDALLPQKLIPVIVALSGIAPETPVHQVTREERQQLVMLLKSLPVTVKKALPVEQAIITRGGVSVKEINPSTMESKLVKNLFFAGELIDVDACTGGYNLQIACSTGALAGRSME
ncbi:MAG: NAD(P)/FAD-dependent oxidoreductase [Clostridia bacterium]|nr:NAD(P)/FAD-dependent oxidoreductase [Clostridia bacterium]